MDNLRADELAYNTLLLNEVEAICIAGDIAALDGFMYSNRGYRFGYAHAMSGTDNIVALAMRTVLHHGQWDVLAHVLSAYNPPISNAIDSLIVIDSGPEKLPTPQWIHDIRRIIHDMLLPLLPRDDQRFMYDMRTQATNYKAWSVWMALQDEGVHHNRTLINYFIEGLRSTASSYWVQNTPIWFSFMLEHSNDDSVIHARQQVANWPIQFRTAVEEELHNRQMVRATVLQGAHTRLGANSPIRLLDPELLRYTMQYALPPPP